MILLVSVTWHWVHMYKATWATKHSKLMQSVEIPPECRPQDMTWFQTIQSSASALVSSVDKCEEYHKVKPEIVSKVVTLNFYNRQSSLIQFMK